MLLGMFSAKGVLSLEFKRTYSVGDLLTQQLDKLEQEAERRVMSCKRWLTTSPKYLRLLLRSAIAEFDAISLAPTCADLLVDSPPEWLYSWIS